MPAVSYTLLVQGVPAGPDLLAAVQQVEVEDHADMADMLRLRIAISVGEGCSDWSVVDEDLFPPLGSVRVLVTVGSGPPEPLIDAFVIETHADFANQPGQSVLNVVAMDRTVKLNLRQRVHPWPNMADSEIATTLFGEHALLPAVEPTQPARHEVETRTLQRGTDMQFLRQLAQRNGYECYVETNPLTGLAEGHFHPPRVDQKPQGVLSVNLGEATNVNRFSARYDMLRPTQAQATGVDVATRQEQPAQVESGSLTELGGEPALNGNARRRVLLSGTGLAQAGELNTYAQAVVDRSSWAISADGELNAVAYGGILRAKRPVNVRGAGRQFSGTYYVERVLHHFAGDNYAQRFTLRRNALGLTGSETFQEDRGLP